MNMLCLREEVSGRYRMDDVGREQALASCRIMFGGGPSVLERDERGAVVGLWRVGTTPNRRPDVRKQ